LKNIAAHGLNITQAGSMNEDRIGTSAELADRVQKLTGGRAVKITMQLQVQVMKILMDKDSKVGTHSAIPPSLQ